MACTCVCTCGFLGKRNNKKFWNEKYIYSAIGALADAGFDVRYTRLVKADRQAAGEVIARATGRVVSPRALYNATIRAGIPWRDAVEKAGYSNARSKIKKRNFWNKELIVRCIKELKREGHALHTKGVRWDRSPEKSQVLFRITGESITGQGLFKTGQKLFGNWRSCLIAAGINPRDARFIRPKRAKDRYAHLPIRFEGAEVNGKRKAIGLLGFAPQDPEERVIISSQIARISPFLEALRKEDRALMKAVISTLLSNNEAENLESAIQAAGFRNNKSKLERARYLFTQLKAEVAK